MTKKMEEATTDRNLSGNDRNLSLIGMDRKDVDDLIQSQPIRKTLSHAFLSKHFTKNPTFIQQHIRSRTTRVAHSTRLE